MKAGIAKVNINAELRRAYLSTLAAEVAEMSTTTSVCCSVKRSPRWLTSRQRSSLSWAGTVLGERMIDEPSKVRIGLGAMGLPMAANVARAGHDVTAYDHRSRDERRLLPTTA